ncbi:hypothetical protein E2493_13255 [Sphingomonas parva]|uniref:DUF3016 domain-containing protein n=1 Tax=Sphingomonas parva TaxID=2555898 RepID=A0A4Y8ZSM0_9SPHN|nr:hypothetical protein [Sphingomonas parva]TFI57789.1 hypothetical protein E2493_13255 [Sphingomonas parva]
MRRLFNYLSGATLGLLLVAPGGAAPPRQTAGAAAKPWVLPSDPGYREAREEVEGYVRKAARSRRGHNVVICLDTPVQLIAVVQLRAPAKGAAPAFDVSVLGTEDSVLTFVEKTDAKTPEELEDERRRTLIKAHCRDAIAAHLADRVRKGGAAGR